MKIDVMFPSKYLKASDLNGKDFALTIKAITIDEVVMRGGGKKKKGVLWFEGAEKQLILNKSNATGIDESVGGGKGDTDNWIGKRIILTAVQTMDKRDKGLVDCIRIRRESDKKVYFIEGSEDGWFVCPIGGNVVTKKEATT